MKSMTGYNFSEFRINDSEYRLELKSYNSKGLEFSIRLPEEISFMESEIRDELKKIVKRGKIYLKISSSSSEVNESSLNEEFIIENIKRINAMEKHMNISLDKSFLLSRREAFFESKDIPKENELKKIVMKNLVKACKSYDSFRKREGKKHLEDINKSIKSIIANLKKIEGLLPSSVENIKKKYSEKFNEFIKMGPPASERVFQEIAILVDKADVNEELVRFKEHLNFFKKSIKKDEGSKKMVFITQEMLREMNTMGVKCGDAAISHLVVENKNEIEKIRELLMNIE